MIVYHAEHVLPVASTPIRDGALAVHDGRIVELGPAAEVEAFATEGGGPVERRQLGRVVILPGLVNAHTHLELSWARDQVRTSGDWSAWLRELLAARADVTLDVAQAACATAIAEVVRRGTVAVGDIENESWAAPLMARAGLHGVAFLEVYSLRDDPGSAEGIVAGVLAQRDALLRDPAVAAAAGRLRVVPTPHAPHTTSIGILGALARRAESDEAPLSIHVAESVAESTWLRDGSGPLAEFFRESEFVDATWEPPGRSPIEYLHRLGVLGPRTLAVHCVQLDTHDRALLQASGATVVTCPRSNRRLGVGTAPVLELLREGIPVALGTDSLASCPDLDLFREMAALRTEHPTLAPAAVVRMATLTGAQALGLDDRIGSLEPGKLDAAIVVPLPVDCDDPAAALCAVPDVVYPLGSAPAAAPETGAV